jgi:hypothetical protein
LPFIALAAVQVLLVAVAPSRGPLAGSGQPVASGGFGSQGNAGTQDAGASGGAATTGAAGGVTAAANGGASGGPSAAGGSATAAAAGGAKDMSKCDPRTGKEIGPLVNAMPPCLPVFHGQNGGATMTGVTSTTVNFVTFQIKGDPQVNSILATQGLAATNEQWCEGQQAFGNEIQKRWELFGRKLVSLDGPGANKGSVGQSPCHFPYFQSQCTTSPADEPCYRAEAKVIASMKPAAVLAEVVDTAFYDELSKNHIVVIAGGGNAGSLATYVQSAPYYYGVFMDGTRQAMFDAEYWCKKLNNKPASHAGADVMTARNWGPAPGVAPTRKLAVAFPQNSGDTSNKVSVDLFVKLLSGGPGSMCKTPGGVLEFPYSQDINTAQQQSQTGTNSFIQNHITTVMCWCDLIAPVLLTQTAKANGYFPEHFLAGEGLMDVDQVARLYDPSEWAHAFGVSDQAEMPPFAQSDATKAWQDVGNPGQPDVTENLPLLMYEFLGNAFMEAGPSPTPALIHQGLVALGTNGGWAKLHDPHIMQWGLDQQSPWTFAEDAREVYWSQSRTSPADGKPGSYCPVAAGRRYNLGEFATGDPDVFDSASNGC